MHIHYIVITPFVKCQFESVEKQARRAVPSAVPLLHTLAPAGSVQVRKAGGGGPPVPLLFRAAIGKQQGSELTETCRLDRETLYRPHSCPKLVPGFLPIGRGTV
jgi:hypothetical protein